MGTEEYALPFCLPIFEIINYFVSRVRVRVRIGILLGLSFLSRDGG